MTDEAQLHLSGNTDPTQKQLSEGQGSDDWSNRNQRQVALQGMPDTLSPLALLPSLHR